MPEYRDMGLGEFIGALAASTPTPGGGTAAAVAGAMAAGLIAMAASISLRRNPGERTLEEACARADRLREGLLELAGRDAAAYEAVVAAYRLPKGTEEERRLRAAKIQEALQEAAAVPLRTAELALEVLETAKGMRETVRKSVLSDLLVAVRLAHAAAHAALYNVDVNLSSLEDGEAREKLRERRAVLMDRTEELARDLIPLEGRLRDD